MRRRDSGRTGTTSTKGQSYFLYAGARHPQHRRNTLPIKPLSDTNDGSVGSETREGRFDRGTRAFYVSCRHERLLGKTLDVLTYSLSDRSLHARKL